MSPIQTLHFNKNFWTLLDDCDCLASKTTDCYGTGIYNLTFHVANRHLSITYKSCLWCNSSEHYDVCDEQEDEYFHESMDEQEVIEYVRTHYPMIEIDVRVNERGMYLFGST